MSYGLAQARYASDATETVSSQRLLTMLYDRLITDLMIAEQAIARGDIATTGERIGHAQEILLELYSTLDLKIWPDGEPLAQLYIWLVNELMSARSSKNAEQVNNCRMLLTPIRDAWHSAASGGVPPAAPATPMAMTTQPMAARSA